VAKPLIGTAATASGIAFDWAGLLVSRSHHTQPAASYVRPEGAQDRNDTSCGVCELCAHVQREAVRRWPSRRWGVIWQAAAARIPTKDSHLARDARSDGPTTQRVGASELDPWKSGRKQADVAFRDQIRGRSKRPILMGVPYRRPPPPQPPPPPPSSSSPPPPTPPPLLPPPHHHLCSLSTIALVSCLADTAAMVRSSSTHHKCECLASVYHCCWAAHHYTHMLTTSVQRLCCEGFLSCL
jgi:hypothetical protein